MKNDFEFDTNILNFNSNSTRLPFSRKRKLYISRLLKKDKSKNLNYLDIYEISIATFYANARNKNNKLFSLILNKISSKLRS